jgi:hypothetical protein
MSLKIIRISGIDDFLTVDNTIITVDSDLYTADMILDSNITYFLRVPYRFFTNEVKLILWSEIKQVETIIELTVTEEDGLMILEFYHDFIDNETFEVKITDLTDKLIWRGKIMATIQTDLQDYILHNVVDNNIIKI